MTRSTIEALAPTIRYCVTSPDGCSIRGRSGPGPSWANTAAPSPQPVSSLLAAERRLVPLSGRIACLLVDERCGLGERGGAGPGREVAGEPALPDAPPRPLRQQAQRRAGVAGEVAVPGQARRHLDPGR